MLHCKGYCGLISLSYTLLPKLAYFVAIIGLFHTSESGLLYCTIHIALSTTTFGCSTQRRFEPAPECRFEGSTLISYKARKDCCPSLSFRCNLSSGQTSSKPGEFHPELLTEPNVKVSLHSALVIQPLVVFPFSSDRTSLVVLWLLVLDT